MRLASVLSILLAGCGFDGPAAQSTPTDAAGGDSGSSGSDSGSGSGCDADADGDGVCDANDDWPCGARPAAPGSANGGDFDANWSASDVDVAGTSESLAVVAANTDFTVDFLYRIYVECPGGTDGQCNSQLEIGTEQILLRCATSVMTENDEVRLRIGTAAPTLQLPARATPYQIRLNLGVAQDACASSYTGGGPDSDPIALVCVR